MHLSTSSHTHSAIRLWIYSTLSHYCVCALHYSRHLEDAEAKTARSWLSWILEGNFQIVLSSVKEMVGEIKQSNAMA